MHFSASVLAVAASKELFLAPVQPDLAPLLSQGGMEVYPAAYQAAAVPLAAADGFEYVEYVDAEQSSDFLTPTLVVAAFALAGYTYSRASTQSEELAPIDEEDSVSALELAGPADVAMLSVQGRREVLAKAGAALASMAAVQSASAKAGQFSKIEIFSIVGEPGISSPYQAGGPKSGAGSTYGYAKSEGEILATGYEKDVSRERASLEVSKKIVRSQGNNIDKSTWYLVRDNLRGQAYNMKANMLAINAVLEPKTKEAATKAYNEFWKEINSLDLACTKKELALAKKEYEDVLAALKKYEDIVG
jgi:hypothetical protein